MPAEMVEEMVRDHEHRGLSPQQDLQSVVPPNSSPALETTAANINNLLSTIFKFLKFNRDSLIAEESGSFFFLSQVVRDLHTPQKSPGLGMRPGSGVGDTCS